jgi:hypothetical protein
MNNRNIRNIIVFLIILVLSARMIGIFETKTLMIEENEEFYESEAGLESESEVKSLDLNDSSSVTQSSDFITRDVNARYKTKLCPCSRTKLCSCGSSCGGCNCESMFDVYYDSNAKFRQTGNTNCFDDGIDWRVNQSPGANNTNEDNVWHTMAPSMVLQDNCLDCKKWLKGAEYNPPSGMLNDLASMHDSGHEIGQINNTIYSKDIPSVDMHTMSGERKNGIMKQKHDCVNTMVNKSKCID